MQNDNFEKWCVNLDQTPQEKPAPDAKFIMSNKIENGSLKIIRLSPDQVEARTEAIKNIINEAINKSLETPIYLVTDIESVENKLSFDFSNADGRAFDPKKIKVDQKCNISTWEAQKGDLLIKGAIVGKLNININEYQSINLENCCIYEIVVNLDTKVNLTLNRCLIGKLVLWKNSINNLSINEGAIISMLSPPPGVDNPFKGSVTFDSVYFPTKKSLLFKGPQQYRNLRSHFEALQNTPAANLMREKELASEREADKGLSKVFSWLYFIISNYGTKPGKPLWWLLGVYVLMSLIIYTQKGLLESLILPFQAILYPVGVLRKESNFSELSICVKFLIQILALVADGLIIFVIAGLRKRFKTH
jgi:hypothetical protein